MIEAKGWHQEKRAERALKALRKNGFEAIYAPTREEAVSRILGMVPAGAVVGLGGSVTARELGLPELLRGRGHRVADHWEARERGASEEEFREIRRLHITSDVFITSSNAVTETGELVNVDGGGNRVAAMIFGPGKVVVVAGVNKLATDIDEGLERAWNVAAPMNARRLRVKTPCAVTGVCSDCETPDRICGVTTIMHRRPKATEVTVILVGEPLGY